MDVPPGISPARCVAVLAIGFATFAICVWATPPPGKSEAGIEPVLPNSVGEFWGTDEEISEGERVILPGDTEFAKKRYTDLSGDMINAQIVLAGAEKRSIHRPEVCLPAQGWTLKSGEVVPITLKDGKTLQVMKLRISRLVGAQGAPPRELTSWFLYWFVGKETTTPYHIVRILKTNLDMLLHNTNHRWAYVVVSAPVLKGFTAEGKDSDETLKMAEEFISEVAPEILRKD